MPKIIGQYFTRPSMVDSTIQYLVGSNERVHSQMVFHYFLCRIWRMRPHPALQQSGGAFLTRLSRRAGGLEVAEEGVPGL